MSLSRARKLVNLAITASRDNAANDDVVDEKKSNINTINAQESFLIPVDNVELELPDDFSELLENASIIFDDCETTQSNPENLTVLLPEFLPKQQSLMFNHTETDNKAIAAEPNLENFSISFVPELLSEQPIIFDQNETLSTVPNLENFSLSSESLPKQSDMVTDFSANCHVNVAPSLHYNADHGHDIDLISDESNDATLLVPYSEHSDSDVSSDTPKKSTTRKKRFQVKQSLWHAEKNRRRRELGKRYLGRNKKDGKWNYDIEKEPREMKRRCRCIAKEKSSFKCTTISEEVRKDIFSNFWNLTWGEKKVLVDSMITAVPTKRHRDRKDSSVSRREQSLLYYLRVNDQNIRVCKTMFLNTLGIGKWTALSWKNHPRSANDSTLNRETSSNRVKPFEADKKELESFLNSLPTMESHYCRSSSKKKYLLPEWPSKKNLYDFYVKDWCKSRNVKHLSIASFMNALNLHNIALFLPKKDQCEKCASYKTGQMDPDQYNLHVLKKNEAREEKKRDSLTEPYVFTVDLQAVLMAPKSNISSLYYKTKLCVHNLCFFNLQSKDGYCYVWNETEGGINAEEFATIYANFLETKVLPQISTNQGSELPKVILYSDGCSYQNRNSVVTNALLNVAMRHKITIIQKYLEVGHTQMEADAMHSTIERRVRKRVINVPAEYAYVCKTAREKPRPYEVAYLEHSFFKSFKNVEFFRSIRPGKLKGDPKVCPVMQQFDSFYLI